MGNVPSLPNKTDKLTALTSGSVVNVASWCLPRLTDLAPDETATLGGFQMRRADRMKDSGKRKGGGLIVFVNDR